MGKWNTAWGPIRALDNEDGTFTMLSGLRQSPNLNAGTIASGTAVSGAISTVGYGPRGLAVQTPAEWTAADIGFDVSNDGTTFYPLYGEMGSRVKISNVGTATAAVYIAPAESWVLGSYKYVRLHSLDTSDESDENQAAERVFSVSMLA